MGFPAITDAISAVKNITEVVSGLSSLPAKKENLELTNMLSSLLSRIIEIQHYVLELETEKVELESKLSQISNWSEETERNYKLVALSDGVNVYAPREDLESEQGLNNPPHFLCPRCFVERRKYLLNKSEYGQYGRIYKCPKCASEFCDHNDRPPTYNPTVPNTRRNKWGV